MLTITEERNTKELWDEVHKEVYDRFYDVFGYLLSEEQYLDLIKQEVQMLVNERLARINLISHNAIGQQSDSMQGTSNTPCTNNDPLEGGESELHPWREFDLESQDFNSSCATIPENVAETLLAEETKKDTSCEREEWELHLFKDPFK